MKTNHRGTLLTGTVAVLLAAGWGVREAQWASAQGKRLENATYNAADVKTEDATDDGKATGKVQFYLDGPTSGTRSLHAGRFVLNPGASPHAPHTHPDEEVLIVSRGQGEIIVDGKTTPVKAGAMMFTDANVSHGIKNTGERPLEFYWVKYVPSK